MAKWSELIEEHYDELLDTVEEVSRDAIENPHLEYRIYLKENGTIFDSYSTPGNNFMPLSVWEGRAILLLKVNIQHDVSDDYEKDSLVAQERDYAETILKDRMEAYA